MLFLRVRRAEIVDEAETGGQADGVDDQFAVFIPADRFAEPRRLDDLRMLVGQVDAAHHVIALPDHPHLFRRLDEVHRLDWIEQLPGNAARITSPLGRERQAALAAEHLLVRGLHLRGGPGLEDRIIDVADRRRHLPGTVEVAVKRVGGMLLDRTVPGPGRRIEKAAGADPAEALARERWDRACYWR